MYSELYKIWKQELESKELTRLPEDFYTRIVDYFKKLREEHRMLDKRTVKALLLSREMRNVKFMTFKILNARYTKLIAYTVEGKKITSNLLTREEEKFYKNLFTINESFCNFVNDVLQGHLSSIDLKQKHRRIVLRFFKPVPAIVGADMKTYGPFKAEDVASVPDDNAKILINRDLAGKVEIS